MLVRLYPSSSCLRHTVTSPTGSHSPLNSPNQPIWYSNIIMAAVLPLTNPKRGHLAEFVSIYISMNFNQMKQFNSAGGITTKVFHLAFTFIATVATFVTVCVVFNLAIMMDAAISAVIAMTVWFSVVTFSLNTKIDLNGNNFVKNALSFFVIPTAIFMNYILSWFAICLFLGLDSIANLHLFACLLIEMILCLAALAISIQSFGYREPVSAPNQLAVYVFTLVLHPLVLALKSLANHLCANHLFHSSIH